jgi:hypothetical protein
MSQKYSELKDQVENMHRESQLLKSENKSLEKITINLERTIEINYSNETNEKNKLKQHILKLEKEIEFKSVCFYFNGGIIYFIILKEEIIEKNKMLIDTNREFEVFKNSTDAKFADYETELKTINVYIYYLPELPV